MALQIQKQTRSGVEANYWRIGSTVGFDCITGRGSFPMFGYIDRENRFEYEPLDAVNIPCVIDAFDASMPTVEQLYGYLKTLPEFSGAVDVLED